MTEAQIIDTIETEHPVATPFKNYLPLPTKMLEIPAEVELELATLLTAVGVN